MRKLTFILLLALSFAACKKSIEVTTTPPPKPITLSGTWEWYRSFEFFHGLVTPQTTGKTWTLILQPDSTYKSVGNYMPQNRLDSIGNYNIYPGTPFLWFHSATVVIGLTGTYKLSADSLSLDTGSSFDNPVYYFVRK